MTAIQAAAIIVAGVAGTAVVFSDPPLRQVLVLAIFGLALTLLFFVLQAPDVALSEIVVSGIALPLIALAALRKIAGQTPPGGEDDET